MKKFLTIFMLFTFVISIQAFSQFANSKTANAKSNEMFLQHQQMKADIAYQKELQNFKIQGSEFTKGGGVADCPANSLFSRPYDDPETASVSEVEFSSGSLEIATNFSTTGGSIETVSIWMLSMNNSGGWAMCNENPMNVNVRFYQNNGGSVGALAHEFLNLSTVIVPAGINLFGEASYPVSFMTITLPQNVDMVNGFISVQGTTPASGTNCWLMWVDAIADGTGYVNDGTGWEANDNGYTLCLGGTPAACPAPSNIILVDRDQTSLTINWTENGTATEWNIEYGVLGFTPTGTPTISGVTTRPYTINSLNPATAYAIYIQSECGSVWQGPKVLYTECNETTVPYTENFNSVTPPALPNCTSVENLGGGNAWVTASTTVANLSGNALVYNYHSTNDANTWFYTRGISLDAGVDYIISFKYAARSASYPESLKVAYGTSSTAASMTNQLVDFPNIANTSGILSETIFSPSADGVYYFGFNCYSEADTWQLFVDDIEIIEAPSCFVPTNQNVGATTNTSAVLTWAHASATEFEIEWGVANFTQGNGTVVPVTGTSYTLGSLAPSTAYSYYLRAKCGDGDYSEWIGPKNFSTQCETLTQFPYSTTFTSDFPSLCWTVISTNAVPESNWHYGETPTMVGADIEYGDGTLMDEWLVSPVFDFSAVTENIELSFDFMMSYYWMVDPNDGADLFVKVTTDGGATWTTIWQEEDYGQFETFQKYTATVPFPYAGQSSVQFAFHYYGDDGAQVVLNNVNLTQSTGFETINAQNINIYPNPSNGIVTITNVEGANIEIVSVTGQVISSLNANSNIQTIDVSNLNNGTYIVRIINNDKVSVKTLSIVK